MTNKKRKKKISRNRNYIHGRSFEYRVCKRFFQWGYVKRSYASKGLADIVAIKRIDPDFDYGSLVAFIQCKYSSRHSAEGSLSEIDKKALANYALDCGAVPIFAYNYNRKVKLVNLLTGKEFIP